MKTANRIEQYFDKDSALYLQAKTAEDQADVRELFSVLTRLIPDILNHFIRSDFSNVFGKSPAECCEALFERCRKPGMFIRSLIILILSNTDSYVVEPVVHFQNTLIPFLWAFFSVCCCVMLFGTTGVMIACTVCFSVSVIRLRHPLNQNEKEASV